MNVCLGPTRRRALPSPAAVVMASDAAWKKRLGGKPGIRRTASVRDTAGAHAKVAESCFGDCSDVIYAAICKGCCIAARVRSNPGANPLGRAMLSHVSYRSSAHDLGPDEPGLFAGRRTSPVRLGHDVRVGHGAIILPGVKAAAALRAAARRRSCPAKQTLTARSRDQFKAVVSERSLSIGDGAAIGDDPAVTKEAPPSAVVVGNPGRVIRQRSARRMTEALQWIAWCDWPHERAGAALEDVGRPGAAAFCAKHDRRAHSKPDARTPPGAPYSPEHER